MRSLFALWLLAGIALTTQAFAAAEETALWKTVGNWGVYIDRTMRYQCFTSILYEDYTFFRIGIEQPGSPEALYVSLGNPNWESLEEGKDYDLLLQINDDARWRSPARAIKIGTVPALVVVTSQADFVEQLMRKHSLQVWFNNQRILNLSLQGSSAALREMLACQTEVDNYLGSRQAAPKDPFSGAAAPESKKDPFAY